MKKVIKLTTNHVAVEQKKEEVTKSGIVLPTEALEGGSMEVFAGTILGVGPDVTKFKKGDFVSFGKHTGSIKKWHGKEVFLLFEYAICATESEKEDAYSCESDEFAIEMEAVNV